MTRQRCAIYTRKSTEEAVKRRLEGNGGGARARARTAPRRPLEGLVHDAGGRPMRSTWSARAKAAGAGRVSRRYWYYVSRRSPGDETPAARLPAEAVERFARDEILDKLRDPDWLAAKLHAAGASHGDLAAAPDRGRARAEAIEADGQALRGSIERMALRGDAVLVTLSATPLVDGASRIDGRALTFEARLRLRQDGRARPIVMGARPAASRRDPGLVALVADARRWMRELQTGAVRSVGKIERREHRAKGSVSRLLPLAFLAPDIAAAILEGRQPEDLTPSRLRRLPDVPLHWSEQRRALGFEAQPA